MAMTDIAADITSLERELDELPRYVEDAHRGSNSAYDDAETCRNLSTDDSLDDNRYDRCCPSDIALHDYLRPILPRHGGRPLLAVWGSGFESP